MNEKQFKEGMRMMTELEAKASEMRSKRFDALEKRGTPGYLFKNEYGGTLEEGGFVELKGVLSGNDIVLEKKMKDDRAYYEGTIIVREENPNSGEVEPKMKTLKEEDAKALFEELEGYAISPDERKREDEILDEIAKERRYGPVKKIVNELLNPSSKE